MGRTSTSAVTRPAEGAARPAARPGAVHRRRGRPQGHRGAAAPEEGRHRFPGRARPQCSARGHLRGPRRGRNGAPGLEFACVPRRRRQTWLDRPALCSAVRRQGLGRGLPGETRRRGRGRALGLHGPALGRAPWPHPDAAASALPRRQRQAHRRRGPGCRCLGAADGPRAGGGLLGQRGRHPRRSARAGRDGRRRRAGSRPRGPEGGGAAVRRLHPGRGPGGLGCAHGGCFNSRHRRLGQHPVARCSALRPHGHRFSHPLRGG
mmetsp:Transcript_143383/g.458318  ORF Transcript_143383/g.458318 Transcript_143383/m.458318 type:complete len:263 (+) Transcript_143383:202-990(+)